MKPIDKIETLIGHHFENNDIPIRLCVKYLRKQFPDSSWSLGQTLKAGGRFLVINKEEDVVFSSLPNSFNSFYTDLAHFMESTILDEKLNILFKNN